MLVLTACIFQVALVRGVPDPEARSLTSSPSCLASSALFSVNRTFSVSIITAFRRRNTALRWVMLLATTMLGVTLLVPFVQRMFRFGPLHADDLAVTVASGLLAIVILELLKPLWRRRLMN